MKIFSVFRSRSAVAVVDDIISDIAHPCDGGRDFTEIKFTMDAAEVLGELGLDKKEISSLLM